VPALILAMPSCHFCFSQLFFFYGQTVKTPLQDSLGKRGFEKQTYTQKISISDWAGFKETESQVIKTSNWEALNYGSTAVHKNISIILTVDRKKLP